MKFYIAAPLFTTEERKLVEDIGEDVRSLGHEVFMPHCEGLLVQTLAHYLHLDFHSVAATADARHDMDYCTTIANKVIFAIDVYKLIEECQALIFVMNGATEDTGTVMEATLAWSLGYPIVAYKDDPRSLLNGQANPMIQGIYNFRRVCNTREQILKEVVTIIKSNAIPNNDVKQIPTLAISVQNIIHEGKKYCEWLDEARKGNKRKPIELTIAQRLIGEECK